MDTNYGEAIEEVKENVKTCIYSWKQDSKKIKEVCASGRNISTE